MKTESLNSKTDYEQALTQSEFLLFKHSQSCSVSGEAAKQYNAFAAANPVPSQWVDVVADRDLSRWIAEASGVKHESPQAIFFRDGQAVWNASHWDITADSLAKAVADRNAVE